MINQLLNKNNLYAALAKVVGNKGRAGIDGLKVEQLYAHLKKQGNNYVQQIGRGCYQVQPILGVEIPKATGGFRLLGIPTVVDRMFQQALCQILEPLFEPNFCNHSYGFRPNRNAQDAVNQSLSNINLAFN